MLEEIFKDICSKDDKDKFVELLKNEKIYEIINGYNPEQRIDAIYFVDEKAKLVGAYKLWNEKKKLKIKKIDAPASFQNKEVNMTDFKDQPIELYCGEWIASTSEGIVKYKGTQEIRVGYQPILITKRIINIENDSEKFEVAYYDQGKWKTKFIPRTTLSNTNSITKLVDMGIDVSSNNAYALISYISDLYMYNKNDIPIIYSVSHLGWTNSKYDQFLPYTKGDIICDCEGEMKNIMQLYKTCGDYDKWLETMIKCRKKDIVKIVMASSFASPLIKMTGINGFITHICGDRGRGKTILLMLAMGIWGAPGLGELTNSINNTMFALECRAHFLQNLPFSGDELQNADKKEINNDALIYMIANGGGKGRGDKDRQVQKQKAWALNMITTGEDKITKDNSHGGSKVRCIEIENEDDIFDLANISELANTIKDNYGFAGRIYVDYIISLGRDVINERYKKIRETFMRNNPLLDGKQINAISLLKLANELSVECIFKDDSKISDDVLLGLVKNELEISVAERAKEYLLNQISVNMINFEVKGSEIIDYTAPLKREFWGYVAGNLCYINKNTVDKILRDGGYSFSEVKKKWGINGFINEYKGKYYHWNDRYNANFVQLTIPSIINAEYDSETEKPPF